MKKSIYLAGPMAGNPYTEMMEWREEFRKSLPSINCLSPLRGKTAYLMCDDLNSWDKLKRTPLGSRRGIAVRDRMDVKNSSLVVANFLNFRSVSIGTCWEIGLATAYDIPYILIMEDNNIHQHPLLTNGAMYIVNNVDEAITLTELYFNA